MDTLRTNPNLHLRAGALAINNGTNLPDAPVVDFDNCPRSVGQIDIGAYEYGACVTSSPLDDEIGRSDSYQLNQNFPNPFNPTTKIRFSLPNVAAALPDRQGGLSGYATSLRVYDLLGREVTTLVNDNLPSGRYEVTFDASSLASGLYFYRIVATGAEGTQFVDVKKLLLLR